MGDSCYIGLVTIVTRFSAMGETVAAQRHGCGTQLNHAMNISPQKLLYSLEEAARLLSYHARTIYRMIDNREIKAVRIRHRWMIPHEVLIEYINSQPTNLS